MVAWDSLYCACACIDISNLLGFGGLFRGHGSEYACLNKCDMNWLQRGGLVVGHTRDSPYMSLRYFSSCLNSRCMISLEQLTVYRAVNAVCVDSGTDRVAILLLVFQLCVRVFVLEFGCIGV